MSKRPRQVFLDLLNDIVNQKPGYNYTEEYSKNNNVDSIRTLVHYINKNCIHYGYNFRLLNIRDINKVLLVTCCNFIDTIDKYIKPKYYAQEYEKQIFIDSVLNNLKAQDRLTSFITMMMKENTVIYIPVRYKGVFGYKTVDNFRDGIYRSIYTIRFVEKAKGMIPRPVITREVITDEVNNTYPVYKIKVGKDNF